MCADYIDEHFRSDCDFCIQTKYLTKLASGLTNCNLSENFNISGSVISLYIFLVLVGISPSLGEEFHNRICKC